MASLWQKALWALGLTDDDGVESETSPQAQVRKVGVAEALPGSDRIPAGDGPGVPGRRVEPPVIPARRGLSSNPHHAEAGVYVRANPSGITTLPNGGLGVVEVIGARTFSDAQLLADHIRSGTAVALDLRGAETAMVRRLVDFSSGLTYGLGGKMIKISRGVILVTPANVSIGIEDRQRLIDMGLYAAPDPD
jgi:hypothetical protein